MNVINMSKKTSKNIDTFDLPIEVFNTDTSVLPFLYGVVNPIILPENVTK